MVQNIDNAYVLCYYVFTKGGEPQRSSVMRLKSIIISLAFMIGAIAPLGLIAGSVSAQAIDNSPDCDKYSVMWCGGSTMNEIRDKYTNGDGHYTAANIKGVFSNMGITSAELNVKGFVDGVVYQNGNVTVNGTVVAKNAKTYIRTMGKVSASKMGSAQTAFVKLNANGQFMYAVMKPCGNPVSATNTIPTPKPAPTPKPTPTPTPTPTPKPTPTPTPTPTPKPIPAPKQVLTCTAITKIVGNNRIVSTELTASAVNGASITGYSTKFGDGTAAVAGRKAVHQYAKDGKFTIIGSVTGLVNGKKVTITSSHCATSVTFKMAVLMCPTNSAIPATSPNCKATPVTPPAEKAKVLPNTGPGDIFGIFAATSVLGAVGHRIWLFKRG